MIKHCFGVSLKASSINVVRSRLPEEIAEQVVEVVGYMESQDDKETAYLKDKAKRVYKSLLRF